MTRRDWFRLFKNNDFKLDHKERSGTLKKLENKKLEEFLVQNSCQTLVELGKSLQVDGSTVSKLLITLEIIQKQGYWVPYELKKRDIERRFSTVS
ncbi:mariner Mos1 transposase [Trichonephila inaurata madagascariensis]|uniref:Mariner Mos1 transposase n=1 Tax=Trichonephila inaurata madagascariensis TaxID=2747483 RepID=A0A8X6XIL7_9ARAC|nr:mariner Mos1 transposase [Trichonephila inaurata madagascariensis]